MIKTQQVRLSPFKFAGLKPPRNLESNVNHDPAQVAENAHPTIEPQNARFPSVKPCTSSRQSSPAAAGLKPYERIAAEKPGEELAPDAAIWEMYVEEAKEQDNELVNGKNRNLDQMLLFATLFSAILTAFIVESKDLLQQDSAELTVTLLLAIAQSQQRVEQGKPQTLPSIELPPFSAPMSARWINGLWYTALGLSLSAALVAMLAKEWLGSFLASRPRSNQAYALKHQTLKSPAQSAFAALDSIWSNDCPELHPDSYAMLASADLRVIGLVTLAQHSNQDASTIRITTQHAKSISKSLLQYSAIQIDCSLDSQSIANAESTEEADGKVKIPLIELRARYSRALFRVTLCLSFHNNGRAPIGQYPLAHLLDSICAVSQYTDLNPVNCLSTHQPQTEDIDMLPVFGANVVGTGQSYHISPLELGDEDGLLAGLVGVLSAVNIEATPELEIAAGRVLAVVGPMLFHQWLQTEDDKLKKYLQDRPRVLECVNSVLDNWPKALEDGNLTLLPERTLSQLIAVTAIAGALGGGPYGGNLLQVACSALNRRANTADGRNGIRTAVQKAPLTVHNLVLVMEENHRHLNQVTYDSLLRLFLIKPWTGRSIFRDRAVPLTCLPHFLRCLCNWPGNVSKVQAILKELRELLQEDLGRRRTCKSYIFSFLWLSEGFASLASLSQLPEYTAITVECIKSVVHFAMENLRTYSLCRGALSCVIPGLLDCVSVVLKNTAGDAEQVLPVLIFLHDVVALIDSVDAEGAAIAANHAVMSDIEAVLAEPHESFEGFVDLVAVFEGIRARAGLCEWLMEMRNWFLEEAEPGKYNVFLQLSITCTDYAE
ncbi:hypothetical protein FRC07_000240 [Ceratobasidium sp. 392]|nr:hypothetical protein FRC07_000240 [Ceratobasidium sp. 392]